MTDTTTPAVRRGRRFGIFAGERPGTRLLAGAVGGFLAGAGFIALLSWFDTTVGKDRLMPFRVVATLAEGPSAVMNGTADVWVGMAIHAALSVLFGVGFALLTAPVRSNRVMALAGLVYGGVLYVVDFQVLARYVDQFGALLRGPNQPVVASLHLLFGLVVPLFVMRSRREVAGSLAAAYPVEAAAGRRVSESSGRHAAGRGR